MSIGFKDFHRQTDQFLDLYDFLGIPPVSPPNLIYLAIQKIDSFDFQGDVDENLCEEIQNHLAVARSHLLNTSAKRQTYEEEWESYYFPSDGYQTDIEKLCSRNAESRLLGGRVRKKTWPCLQEGEKSDEFNYIRDFTYFVMKDLPNERGVFFLNPQNQIQLSPLKDTLFFEENQFFLKSYGKLQIEVGNDALGKIIAIKEKSADLPLHIGDRIEFSNGARLILRSIYSGYRQVNADAHQESNSSEQLALYFTRENIIIPLQPEKIYVLGRNTSDIHHHLSFDEDFFCFINIGRRERSISRQNFQVFFHQGSWYAQDLGSRYGTTLDFSDHFRFETLAGGSLMLLEPGRIRLGYDKSYIIEVDKLEQCEKRKTAEQLVVPKKQNILTIYDIPIL